MAMMKKTISVLGAVVLVLCAAAGIMRGESHDTDDGFILASVGEAQITQGDVLLLQECDSLVRSFQGASGEAVSRQEALEKLVSEKIKQQMIQDEGICLPEEERQNLRETILWSFDEAENGLESGSEQERESSRQMMDSLESFAGIYGVSMEEYKELCIEQYIFSAEVSMLADKKFNGSRDALETYIRGHYGDYQAVITG